ncbi:MAG: PIN domain-containing protein [Candidatus Latescibacteria bacterium]|nr:PIN domain-containing protein [Candidatus Latescibacterota bacterium]
MQVVLDTHSLLWFIMGDNRLSRNVRTIIEDLDNRVLLSVGSLWEIAIKVNIGKLTLLRAYPELFPAELQKNEIEILPIRHKDLTTLATLSLHHRDPFDRLIIAQAINDNIAIATKDGAFQDYPVQIIW